MLRLNDYKVFEEILKRKLSKQDVISNAMTASEKQLKKKFSLMENEKGLLEKTNGELVKKYGAQKFGYDIEFGEAGEKSSQRFCWCKDLNQLGFCFYIIKGCAIESIFVCFFC